MRTQSLTFYLLFLFSLFKGVRIIVRLIILTYLENTALKKLLNILKREEIGDVLTTSMNWMRKNG